MAEAGLAEAPAAAPARTTLTYEEFLAWTGEETHAEWVNGEVVSMSPVSCLHQSLSGFLIGLLRAFVEEHRAGTILFEPFQMKTGADLPGRSPDLLFVSQAHQDRLHPTYLDGPADLVVEIVNPESRSRDRGEKFYEYQEGGVPEYWLLDPERRQAIFYVRGDDGLYRPTAPDENGVFHSTVLPALWLRVAWLWQDPKPALLEVLREWGLV